MKKNKRPILQLKNVSFVYNSQPNKSIDNISFTLKENEHLVIIGQNGSGKSTLAKVISGLYINFTGNVYLFDKLLNEKNQLEITRQIGLVFQNPESQFIGSTVQNDLIFGLETMCVSPNEIPQKVINITEQIQINSILHEQPVNLSAGDKQRVAFGSTLIRNPRIIILDEPTSLIDEKGKREILKIIQKIREDKTKALIEITHKIERISAADKVLVLEKGKMKFFGSPKDLEKENFASLQKTKGLKMPFLVQLGLRLKENKLTSKLILKEEMILEKLCQLKKFK